MAARRYSFDGKLVTVEELCERVTCYSKPWLAAALRAGCRSTMDLAVRYYESGLRQRQGKLDGAKCNRRRLQYPHLKRRKP